jgi:hypothetical protein
VESPYIEIGVVGTVYYFLFFLVVIPFLGYFEKLLVRVAAEAK